MAKAKERMQALVPVDEQPYEVPENWRWVNTGVVVNLLRGVSYQKQDAHTEKQADDCLIMRGGNVLEGIIDPNIDPVYVNRSLVSEEQLVRESDIVIVASTGSTKVIGRAGVSQKDYSDVAFGAFLMVARPNEKALPQYIDCFFQSDIYRERIRTLASGVNINNIRQEYILTTPCPLPPLPEQRRIVDRIESLFVKLDEAKEKAQAVVDGFETRKAAILHKAFAGELTEGWRRKEGIACSWSTMSADKAFMLKSGTTIPAEQEQSEGTIPYIKVADMNLPGNEIEITTSSRFVNNCSASQIIPKGSTVFPKRGGAILTNKKRYVGVSQIIADLNIMAIIPIKDLTEGWYGYYWMQSIDLASLHNGSNIPQINNKDMVKLKLPVPSLPEQREIVRILDSLLSKEQQAHDAALAVIDRIDAMKKAVLAKAFRGELGTNDINEPAVEV